MATPFLAEFPELEHLSREDLEDLLNDPNYFDAILNTLPRIVAMNQALNELASANESIARNNMGLADQLTKLREDTRQVYDEAQSLKERWKVLEREQNELYSRYAPSFLQLRLRHATTAQDDHSETVASTFIKSQPTSDDGRDVDEFVKSFRELRKIYHKRKIWGDRWHAGQVQWREY